VSNPLLHGFDDHGLPSEHQVCYRVFAVNRAGDSPPSNTDCTTPPAGPTDFSITDDNGGLDLRWRDNSGVEDAYAVLTFYDDGAGNIFGSIVATLPPNSESYHLDDPNVYPPGSYFTVVAVKDGGDSDWAVAAPSTAPLNRALRASAPKDPRIATRSGRLATPFDVRLSSLRKLRP